MRPLEFHHRTEHFAFTHLGERGFHVAEPDAFDPDRFLSANVRSRPGHVYKPWGTGERACIGRQFAIHEAVLVLGTILQQFDIRADPDYSLKIEERLTLMPKNFELTVSVRK